MKLKNIFLCITAIIISIGIYACKDESNIIIPTPSVQLDSARYDWKNILIPNEVGAYLSSNPWMPDTDEVFIIPEQKNKVFHYKSGYYNFIEFPSGVELNDIKGLSPTEGYLFGMKQEEGKNIPYFYRWNGNSFFRIPVNICSDKIFKPEREPAIVRNSNEMWLSSPGVNWKFDGYNLIAYPLPDTNAYSWGFYDKYNKLKCYYFISSYDTVLNSSQVHYETTKILEFDGNDWNIIFQLKQKAEHELTLPYYYFYQIRNTMLILIHNIASDNLYEWNQNNSLNFIKSYPRGLLPEIGFDPHFPIIGNPPNDIIFYGIALNSSIGHWNGTRFSLENTSLTNRDINFARGTMLDSNYCLLWDAGIQFRQVFLLFSKRKNLTKQN
jgi:hypothetical protein